MDFFNPTQHYFKRDTAVLFHPGLKLLYYVTQFECNFFSKLSRKLEFGYHCVYKCFFEPFSTAEAPRLAS